MAIRAGESRGGAEGVAPATVGGIKASGGRATGNRVFKTSDMVGHRPRGHVLLSWPPVRGEDSVLAECTPLLLLA